MGVFPTSDPHAASYAVYRGDDAATFTSDGLTIRRREVIALRSLIVEAAVIGESHYLRVLDAKEQPLFAELLACLPLSPGRPTLVVSLRDRPTWRNATGWRRRETFDVAIRDPTPSRQELEKTFLHRGRVALELVECFPGPADPRTAIRIETTDDTLVVRTLHEYAIDDSTVRPIVTRTSIPLHPELR